MLPLTEHTVYLCRVTKMHPRVSVEAYAPQTKMLEGETKEEIRIFD